MIRRLLIVSLLALAPVAPAHAGPAACVAGNGFPVCAGTCFAGDPISVRAVGTSGSQAIARCGGVEARCTIFLAPTCTSSTVIATSSGPLTCGGSAEVVVCSVGTQIQN